MKKFVTTGDSWQIFSAFVAAMIIYSVVPDDKYIWKVGCSLLLASTIFGWFLILGICLNEKLPEGEQKSDVFLIVCFLYNTILVSVSPLQKDPQFEDVAGYALIVVISFGLSFFYMIYFTSTLYAISQERLTEKERLSGEVIFILFGAFILGIFALQPRLKKIFK